MLRDSSPHESLFSACLMSRGTDCHSLVLASSRDVCTEKQNWKIGLPRKDRADMVTA